MGNCCGRQNKDDKSQLNQPLLDSQPGTGVVVSGDLYNFTVPLDNLSGRKSRVGEQYPETFYSETDSEYEERDNEVDKQQSLEEEEPQISEISDGPLEDSQSYKQIFPLESSQVTLAVQKPDLRLQPNIERELAEQEPAKQGPVEQEPDSRTDLIFEPNTENTEMNNSDKHEKANSVAKDDSSDSSELQEHDADQLQANREKVERIIAEVISTEETYLSGIKLLNSHFRPGLEKLGVDGDILNTIFMKLVPLIEFHGDLLDELKSERDLSVDRLAEIFSEKVTFLRVYKDFVGDYDITILPEVQNLSDKRMLDDLESEVRKPMESLLITPVQRIPRYCLLLGEILRKNKDHHLLAQTVERVKEITNEVNEDKRRSDMQYIIAKFPKVIDQIRSEQNWETFQTACHYLLDWGRIDVMDMERYYFLFDADDKKTDSSLIVWTKNAKMKDLSKIRGTMELRGTFATRDGDVYEIDRPGDDSITTRIGLHSKEHLSSKLRTVLEEIQSTTPQRKLEWEKDKDRKKRQTLRLHMTQGDVAPVHTFYLWVLRGEDLKACDVGGKSDPYVEAEHGAEKHRSNIQKSTLNPRWNERFQFRFKDVHDTTVKIKVWDRDLMNKDDFMGESEINVMDGKFGRPYPLHLGDGNGKLYIKIALPTTAMRLSFSGGDDDLGLTDVLDPRMLPRQYSTKN